MWVCSAPKFNKCLWNSYETSDELLRNSPIVVNQLANGIDLIQEEQERISSAHLCLFAGKLAMKASSFRTAASYFETGQKRLGRRPWRDSYELTLSLFTLAAEVEYAIGNPQTTNELVD